LTKDPSGATSYDLSLRSENAEARRKKEQERRKKKHEAVEGVPADQARTRAKGDQTEEKKSPFKLCMAGSPRQAMSKKSCGEVN